MSSWSVEAAIVAGSLGAWFALYTVMLMVTRPARVAATPATPELGTLDLRAEPPALASLLASGWELTEDAVEATLVDLAARRYFEFRQPDDDPRHTTIHIEQNSPSGLNRYEKRVYDRVAGLAVGGVLPLTALPFRDHRRARSWWKSVRAEIVADARRADLSQRRFSFAHLLTLGLGAALATGGVVVAVVHYAARHPATHNDDDPYGLIAPAILFTFAFLMGFAARDIGERDTVHGREAAAAWLGAKDWLRGHEAFRDLPPAAVATWDRYLSYGVALGVSRVTSTVVDMGMGNRRLVWSSFGGTWHRVHVSYPHVWRHYGQPTGRLIVRSLVVAAIGVALLRYWRPGLDWVAAHGGRFEQLDTARTVGALLGIPVTVYGGYTALRAIIDTFGRRTLTGQVLWMQLWRTESAGEDHPREPLLYYLAVDDGTGDRTRAWALPANLSHQCDTGDTVTIAVRRWSRRVGSVSAIERGSAGHVVAVTESNHEELVAQASGGAAAAGGLRSLLAAPQAAPTGLLSADEVSAALGLPVVREAAGLPGPAATVSFRTADHKRVVLMLQVLEGPLAMLAWRTNLKGEQIGGIGDGGRVNGNRAAGRRGNTLVVLTLVGKGRGRGDGLAELLRTAVARVPAVAAG